MIKVICLCLACLAASPKDKEDIAQDERTSPATVESIISALAEKVPQDLSALEAILGPLQRDPKNEAYALSRKGGNKGLGNLSVSFSIDFYHQDPYKQKNPALKSFRQTFAFGFTKCQVALRQSFGAERVYESGGQPVLRFQTGQSQNPLQVPAYYLYHDKGEGFDLEWRRDVPAFAMPKRTKVQEESLNASIISLFKHKITRSRIESIFGKLSVDTRDNRDVLVTETYTVYCYPSGQEYPQTFGIAFGLPLPAKALIKALAVADPVAVSTDVHQTSRVLADYRTKGVPSAGGLKLYLHLARDQLKYTQLKWPASAVWKAEAYEVVGIEGMAK